MKPAKLRDFVCNLVRPSLKNSYSYSARPTPSELPCKSLYPLIHYMNYHKFYDFHRHFLASVTAEVEHTNFSEVVSRLEWWSA